jgi:hypothetical protein
LTYSSNTTIQSCIALHENQNQRSPQKKKKERKKERTNTDSQRFDLMTKSSKAFQKYSFCPLSTDSFGKKYTSGINCILYSIVVIVLISKIKIRVQINKKIFFFFFLHILTIFLFLVVAPMSGVAQVQEFAGLTPRPALLGSTSSHKICLTLLENRIVEASLFWSQ